MKIFLTRRAEKNYDSIKDHIKEKFGQRTAEQFVQKTDEFFSLLKNYPAIGQVEKNDIRDFRFPRKQEFFTGRRARKL
jgi:plasmid stabilization system protein ParE